MLGFALNDNFNFPYAAAGFSDFWQRWHMSLSTWLRDYLYVPLGGNRRGEWRTYVNLMVTMLLGGLWHGASWTFIAWGGLHGACLVIERAVRNSFAIALPCKGVGAILAALGTFVVVTISWVLFRANTFADAGHLLSSMAGVSATPRSVLYWNDIVAVALIVGSMLTVHWRLRYTRLETAVSAAPPWLLVLVWTLMAFTIVAVQGAGDAFIYFQF